MRFFFSVSLLFALASCAPVYVPLAPSLPLVVQQGELNVSASMSGGVIGNVSASYGLLDQFSIMAETGLEPGDPISSRDDRNFYQLLGGLGYGKSLDNFWRLDVYLGGGLGRGESIGEWGFFGTEHRHMRARFTNCFAQFDIGYVDDEVETGYQLRAIYADFDRFEHLRQEFGIDGNLIRTETEQGPGGGMFLEHSFVAKRGGRNLKAFAFLTLAIGLGRQRDNPSYSLPINAGFGLQLRLDTD